MKVPNTKWRIRRDSDWTTESAEDYFAGKRCLVVSLPGAFTPTCSGMQLPSLEALYDDFKGKGIDEVYCLSVNDSFVMNAWAKEHDIENVKMIPDGSGEFMRTGRSREIAPCMRPLVKASSSAPTASRVPGGSSCIVIILSA